MWGHCRLKFFARRCWHRHRADKRISPQVHRLLVAAYTYAPVRLTGQCVGLWDGRLHWRSPATVAFDREMQAQCAAWEARSAAGRTV